MRRSRAAVRKLRREREKAIEQRRRAILASVGDEYAELGYAELVCLKNGTRQLPLF